MRLFNEIITDFDDLVTYIETNTHEDIVKHLALSIMINRGMLPKNHINQKSLEMINVMQNDVEINYSKFLQSMHIGAQIVKFGASSTIYDAVKSIENNLAKYVKAYDLLEDDFSRKTMFNFMMFRFLLDQKYLTEIRIDGFQYYRPELIPQKENGVLLDCGGFDGQTALDFIDTYSNYKKIYLFEPDPHQFKVCKKNTSEHDDIICINKGVSDEQGSLDFESREGSGANKISTRGNIKVEVTTIDEEIKEPVTFIKMDVEGAEIPALNGCKNHIKNDRPHLTICLYHILSDIFIIPLLLNNFDKNYTHNMRFHGYDTADGKSCEPWELVLYSTPNDI